MYARNWQPDWSGAWRGGSLRRASRQVFLYVLDFNNIEMQSVGFLPAARLVSHLLGAPEPARF